MRILFCSTVLCAAALAPGEVFAQTPAEPPAPAAPAPAPAPPAPSPAPRAAAKKPAEPELPPAPARLWVIAPSPKEPWTLRIDNVGDTPIRVPADVRVLSFEIDAHEKNQKPVRCAAPAGLRPDTFPDKRAVLLAPGESYIEPFDVHLFCFGKNAAALAGGNVVRTHFGWEPPRHVGKAGLEPPFAAQGTGYPATSAPERELHAPTMVLAYGPAPAPPTEAEDAKQDAAVVAPPNAGDAKPVATTAAKSEVPAKPPITDEMAPRLEATSEPYSDAAAPRDIHVGITVRNVGHRPMMVAMQPRNFAFRVSGPDGAMVCDHFPATHAVPRDFFRTLKPGDAASFTVMLNEQCPRLDFDRPGLYEITPTLHAVETGSGLGLTAWTGVVRAKEPTLLRLATSVLQFYKTKPVVVPTPRPDGSPAGVLIPAR